MYHIALQPHAFALLTLSRGLSAIMLLAPFGQHSHHASTAHPSSGALQAHDETQCGAQYSTYTQVDFCDLQYPSTWPAVLQVGM